MWSDFVSHDDVPIPTPAAAAAAAAAPINEPPPPSEPAPLPLPLRTYTQFNDALPPHKVQGPPSVFSAVTTPTTANNPQWSAALGGRGIRAGAGLSPDTPGGPGSGYFGHWQAAYPPGVYGANSRKSSFETSVSNRAPKHGGAGTRGSMAMAPAETSGAGAGLPSLQLHVSLLWATNTFRLTISTSLLINYPSPAFMSLPLQLSVTGFVMRAGVIISLEGERRRAHICLLQEEDEEDGQDETEEAWRGKRRSPGLSILPSLTFDSEVGQADKHALRNVGKVEKFVAEVLRKAIEDELVFPNYYTIDLPPPPSRAPSQ